MTAYIREVGRPEAFQIFPTCTVPPGFLTEMRSYEIQVELGGGRPPDDYGITLNDVPLDRLTRSSRVIFPVEMEFYAGDLRLAVTHGHRILTSCELVVDPDIAKLTRDEYAVMIADISRATLAIYRLSAVTTPAQARFEGARSDLVTLELIRTNFDRFERAVSRIADQPVRTLRSSTAATDILSARRVDDRSIGNALRRGLSREATFAETLAAPRLVGALGGRWIPRVDETRRAEGVEIYENRALLGFLRWLDTALSDIVRRLGNADFSDVNLSAWKFHADRVSRWRARITTLARRGLFAHLRPDPSLHATSIFRTHPDYASAFSAMSRMRAGLGMGIAATPSLPLDRTYELYELWCYIGILAVVAERFPTSRPKIAEILRGCPTASGLGIALASGKASEIPLGAGVQISYQRRFGLKPSMDGARTLLLEVVPDITISRTTDKGHASGSLYSTPNTVHSNGYWMGFETCMFIAMRLEIPTVLVWSKLRWLSRHARPGCQRQQMNFPTIDLVSSHCVPACTS
jgi:hypothetical protein